MKAAEYIAAFGVTTYGCDVERSCYMKPLLHERWESQRERLGYINAAVFLMWGINRMYFQDSESAVDFDRAFARMLMEQGP